MKTEIYIEGAGESKSQKAELREGFRKLFQKMGLAALPRVFACGTRNDAFRDFKTAFSAKTDQRTLLLVDSEDPADGLTHALDDTFAWLHLKKRDGWERPKNAKNDQALLMATCMETWISADRPTLEAHFGKAVLNEKALPPLIDLEKRERKELLERLEKATAKSSKTYKKGKISFDLLAELEPSELRKNLSQFRRLDAVLKQ